VDSNHHARPEEQISIGTRALIRQRLASLEALLFGRYPILAQSGTSRWRSVERQADRPERTLPEPIWPFENPPTAGFLELFGNYLRLLCVGGAPLRPMAGNDKASNCRHRAVMRRIWPAFQVWCGRTNRLRRRPCQAARRYGQSAGGRRAALGKNFSIGTEPSAAGVHLKPLSLQTGLARWGNLKDGTSDE
jgi:hypothetical protein